MGCAAWRGKRVCVNVQSIDAVKLERLVDGRGYRVVVQGFKVGYECLSCEVDTVRIIFGDFACVEESIGYRSFG